MKKHAFWMAAAIAVASIPLVSQEAAAQTASDIESRMELAREIAVIARAEQQLDLAFERMRPAIASAMFANLMRVSPSRNIAEELDARYPGGQAAFKQEYARRYAERFRASYPDMLEEIARYWANNMSLEELEATLAFFRSEHGEAWVALLPGVYQHMTELGREYSLQAGTLVAGEMMNAFDAGGPAEDPQE